MNKRRHVPASDWCIVACSSSCDAILRSPFPLRPEWPDPDGLGTFAAALADELGVDEDEISTTDVARAWAVAMGWREENGEWYCAQHLNKATDTNKDPGRAW